jgi:hypothetical protein
VLFVKIPVPSDKHQLNLVLSVCADSIRCISSKVTSSRPERDQHHEEATSRYVENTPHITRYIPHCEVCQLRDAVGHLSPAHARHLPNPRRAAVFPGALYCELELNDRTTIPSPVSDILHTILSTRYSIVTPKRHLSTFTVYVSIWILFQPNDMSKSCRCSWSGTTLIFAIIHPSLGA